MAYVNVAEWTPEHVAEWLRGLEDSIFPYVHFFLNNNVDGNHLLNLSPDDLNLLHISKVGHQQLILEAVDFLRQLHYGLTSETLQFLALKLGCKVRSLHNDLKLNGPQEHLENSKQERVSTDTLSAVSDILMSVKSVVSWLDRYPFAYQDQYVKIRQAISKLSIELASTAQRDQFVENPHHLIKDGALDLAKLCDRIVQEFNDSLIIQPASLDIATVKKKPEEELGMHIKSTYSGFHIIARIKPQSPTTRCAKVEEGDEIVQVNYQTVIGWQQQKLLCAMNENPTEIHLTLKKRPRHTNILGQVIILRPYRIPSKKTAFGKVHKWSEGNSLHIQEVYSTSNDSENLRNESNDDDDDDDSAFLPDGALTDQITSVKDSSLQYRTFLGMTHATVQRRATVSGASPTILKAPINIEDLVNGVPTIKKKEHVGRSISHDPSKLTTSSEVPLVCTERLGAIKSDDSEENIVVESPKVQESDSFKIIEQNLNVVQLVAPAKFDEAVTSNVAIDSGKEEITTSLSSDVLSVEEEEEYTISENKSLENEKINHMSNSSLNAVGEVLISGSRSDGCQIALNCNRQNCFDEPVGLTKSEKSSELLYPWEGEDMVFHGRRPSAQDISDEIAGGKISSIDPVLLRRASKLDGACKIIARKVTSHWNNMEHEDSSRASKPKACSSYQVIVVGGVPQKSSAVLTDGKRFEYLGPQQKRRSIIGKFGNRRISCKDLGMGDCQGWLYKQKDKKGYLPAALQWTKRWIILKNHYLYFFVDKSDVKAECLIFLPGSTVSPAPECKTKKFCFKICQQKTAFFFATDSQSDLSKWMNKMGLAAISYDAVSAVTADSDLKAEASIGSESNFYSETDDSDDSSYKGFRPVFDEKQYQIHDSSSSPSSSDHSSSACHFKRDQFSDAVFESKSQPYNTQKNTINSNEFINWRNSKHTSSKLNTKPNPISRNEIQYNKGQLSSSQLQQVQYSKIYETKPQQVLCNRSFSYTEASNPITSKSQRPSRKFSCDEAGTVQSLPYKYEMKDGTVKCQQSAAWLVSAEEYDMLTSSLGRQKSVAKEITPGLVARMAVSYSNLSQRNATNASSATRYKLFKGAPAPGYVAKISDSFDYLAKKSSEISACHQLSKSQSVSRPLSPTAQKLLNNSSNSNYKRSASESQVMKNFCSSHLPFSANSTSLLSTTYLEKNESEQNFATKHVSMLDREYNRVYGRKKASQITMKSIQHDSSTADVNSCNRRMKFFPDSDKVPHMRADEILSQVNFNRSSVNDSNSPKPVLSQSFSNFWKTKADVVKVNSGHRTPPDVTVHSKTQDNGCSHSSFRTSQNAMKVKSQIQSVFKHQARKMCSDFSKGIENIGFCAPDIITEKGQGMVPCENLAVSNEDKVLDNDYALADSRPKSCSDHSNPKLNSAFKLFGSPKFMKKLSSPKLDKKNIFKSKKQAKEVKKAELKELTNVQCERKFLGSPRLGRAIFGSPKSPKKNIVTVSSGVQTDHASELCKSDNYLVPPDDRSVEFSLHDSKSQDYNVESLESEENVEELVKSSSNSSLNSDASSSILSASTTSSHYYVETRLKPQITISLPLVTDGSVEERGVTPETPRTPLKPTMGISMLGKRRLPSISGESSLSVASKSSQDDFSDPVQVRTEIKMEIKELKG